MVKSVLNLTDQVGCVWIGVVVLYGHLDFEVVHATPSYLTQFYGTIDIKMVDGPDSQASCCGSSSWDQDHALSKNACI